MSIRRMLQGVIVLGAAMALMAALVPPPGAAAQGPPPPPPPSTVSDLGTYHPLQSARRLVDTRSGLNIPRGALRGRMSRALQVTGRAGVPRRGVSAVVLNVTASRPAGAGSLYLYARGARRPALPSMALQRGRALSRTVIVRVPTNGRLTLLHAARRTHVAVEVLGWYDRLQPFGGPGEASLGRRYVPRPPRRLIDTRVGMGLRRGALRGRVARTLRVTGRAGVPRRGVSAVALNVVALRPSSGGAMYVYARGARRPALPSLTLQRGKTMSTTVVVRVPTNGQLTLLHAARRTHVAIDVLGWYGSSRSHVDGQYVPMDARRVVDSRAGIGVRKAPVQRRATLDLRLAGRAGVPQNGASAVVLNVMGLSARRAGAFTLYARGTRRPTLPSLTLAARNRASMTVVVRLPSSGRLTLFNTAQRVHVAIDVLGWYTAGSTLPPPPPGPPPPPPNGSAGATESSTSERLPGTDAPADNHLDAIVEQRSKLTIAELRRFWTPERIAKASSARSELPDRYGSSTRDRGENTPLYTGSQPRYPIIQQGYLPLQWYSPAVGRLLFYIPSQRSFSNCSATVVGRGLVLTAAHCVVADNGVNYTNFMFIPSQRGTQAPFGNWYANGAAYYSHYLTVQNPHNRAEKFWPLDYAFIKFPPQNGGRSIETVTGEFPIVMNAPTANKWSTGYPNEGSYFSRYCTHGSANVNSCWQYYCHAPVGAYVQSYPGWHEVGWGCNSSGGTSGGPVFQIYNGRWHVSSVNSNAPTLVIDNTTPPQRRFSKNMWGPYFNSWIGDLFRRMGG